MRTRSTQGFTLLELMIVVVVISIIAAVAIPAYNDYITRSKIAEATSALSTGRVKMEQFFQDNKTYIGGPAPSATTYFTYSVSGTSATAYTISANGIGGMAGYTFTIDQNNARKTTAAPSNWAMATMPAGCWLTRKKSC